MMDIQGAIGLCQLKKVEDAVSRRNVIAREYSAAFEKLPGIITPFVRSGADASFQLYTIRVEEKKAGIGRDQFIDALGQRGVASRLYYPALHRAPVFSRFHPGTDEEFPNACAFADTAVSLPLYPTMTEEEIQYVIRSVKQVLEDCQQARVKLQAPWF